jgi:hypothetical protein
MRANAPSSPSVVVGLVMNEKRAARQTVLAVLVQSH